MNRAHSVVVRGCSWPAGHTGGLIVALAVVWMTAAPRPMWGQWTNTNPVWTNSNVGIGTSTPVGALDIARTANDGGVILGLGNGGPPFWQFSRSASTGALSLQGVQTGYNNLLLQPAGGNVGIGTTSPQYLLSVKGTVGAEEFIVTNTGWSDYVFQPGYRLRPLSEIGAYIQANHHLPDIPSETEVKEKGVSVGEMQAKLLAKVEELTLHMIQADERNNRLERQNQELLDRLTRIENGAAGATATAGK